MIGGGGSGIHPYDGKKKVKSVYEPRGPSGRSLSRFPFLAQERNAEPRPGLESGPPDPLDHRASHDRIRYLYLDGP